MTERELWVGFWKKGVEPVGLDYDTAVEIALCFGWIDGIRMALDAKSYTNRFTPRKPGSVWSRINIARVERLMARGEMQPAGIDAFEKRLASRTGLYSFEQRPEAFPADLERRFKKHRGAWAHFNQQPPGYRRLAIWWVASAKKEETRLRRLSQLIDASGQGSRVGVLFGHTAPAKSSQAKASKAQKAR